MNRITALLCVCLVLAPVFSCRKAPIENLTREELFSLTLGTMENQMSLFQHPEVPFRSLGLIYLRDGRIYISDSSSLKIMEFTTYGDLVSLLYNAESNPEPVVLSTEGEESENSNRLAQKYPFVNIGGIVVDSRKRLYVEDEIPLDQSSYDPQLSTVLYKRVLTFDRRGVFIGYIGQEGIGGTSFPHIESMHITENDELVVVSRLPMSRWLVYWYDTEGYLLYKVEIRPDSLPGLEGSLPSLEKLLPDLRSRALCLQVTYYSEEIHEVTGSQDAVLETVARIYRLDLEQESYKGYVEVPESGVREEVIGTVKHEIPAPSYEWLGTDRWGHHFLLLPQGQNQYELLILDSDGGEVGKRIIQIEDTELLYRNLVLSDDGVLVGLLGFEEDVKVVWWRSDRLLNPRGS